MSQVIIMPKLGLTMTHGKITRWLKKEGDQVRTGEIVAEIETDKINSEVESPFEGYLIKILAQEGEEKEITAPICIIGEKHELGEVQFAGNESNAGDTPDSRVFITPAAKKLADENGIDYTKIKGSGLGGRIVEKDILKAIEDKNANIEENAEEGSERIRITPVAKKLAKENGIDYTTIKGTGPDGRITKEDILAAIEAKNKEIANITAMQERPSVDLKIEVKADFAQAADENVVKKVPLSSIRKVIARRLSQSKHDIPHTYFKISVDASNIIELKNNVSEAIKAKTGKKPSINDIIIKAVAVALGEFPDLNASLANDEIIYYRDINVGIAVNTDRGLVVPVIKNAGRKSFSEICRDSGELIEKARNGKLLPDDIAGGTFTVSNLGAYYIDEFCAIINPPESAILAVGRALETPVAHNGEVVIRPIMNLTVSVDHRIIDGALAAQFMKRLKDLLENPYLILI